MMGVDNDDFFQVQNPTLLEALAFRKQHKIPQALAKLNVACEEGDGKAWYLKGKAYENGGWGLHRNVFQAIICLRKSVEAGCGWVKHLVEHPIHMDMYFEALQKGSPFVFQFICYTGMFYNISFEKRAEWTILAAEQGDALALYHAAMHYSDSPPHGFEFAPTKREVLLKRGMEQCEEHCVGWLVEMTYFVDALTYLINYSTFEFGTSDIQRLAQSFCSYKDWTMPELYLFGRWLGNHRASYSKHVTDVFCKTKTTVQQAVSVFVLCCRRTGLLSKDMRKMVGEIIWESRYDPEIWLGTEQISLLKKQKY
jgi:TPR repeat protein